MIQLGEEIDLVRAALPEFEVEGFMAGHRVVVPGKPNRIVTLLPRLFPRGLVLAVAQQFRNQARDRG